MGLELLELEEGSLWTQRARDVVPHELLDGLDRVCLTDARFFDDLRLSDIRDLKIRLGQDLKRHMSAG